MRIKSKRRRWRAVLGVVVAVLLALLTGYSDFRNGVVQLAHDAGVLAQANDLDIIFRTRTKVCDRIRIDKRTGALATASELVRAADTMRDEAQLVKFPMSEQDLLQVNLNLQSLTDWLNDAESLVGTLDSDDARACVAAGLLEELERFPLHLPWFEDARRDTFRARLLTQDVDLAARVDGVAARYARLLALAKQNLRKHVVRLAPRVT